MVDDGWGRTGRAALAHYSEAVALVESGKADPKVVEVVELLRVGYTVADITEILELAKSTVYQRLKDPTNEKNRARKAKFNGVCVDCGGETVGDGSAWPPKRCFDCAIAHQKATKKWTPEAVIEAIQRWAKLYGEAPKAKDWNATGGDDPRYLEGGWPALATVQKVFGVGGWNAALIAAGFEPHQRMGGHPRIPCTQEELDETVGLVKEKGLEAAAIELGMTKDGVKRRLKTYEGRPWMSAPMTADQVLDREIEKCDVRIKRLKDDIKAMETQKAGLEAAKRSLPRAK